VKLIIQTQDNNPKIRSGEVPRYTGIVNCFTRVNSEQGFASFWRGNFTNIIRYFPTQAFNFAFKDLIKGWFPKVDRKKNFWGFFAVNMISGGLAGAGSLAIVYPLDYARTRLAGDVGKSKGKEGRDFTGLSDCITKTLKHGGVKALYNGFGVSVVGIIPYRGVYFGIFDTGLRMNPYGQEKSFRSAFSNYLIAQVAAILAGYASYPIDTVRRRMQMQSEKPKEAWYYKSTGDCFVKVLKEEGVPGFFKGAGANVLRTAGAAMVLVLYQECQKFFGVDLGGAGGE
jgi:solute carrier family 25 (adenine nucleotide translocator) protein 4/5/6/31